jgi:hypothetical protein
MIRAWGEEECVTVPEKLGGRPVVEIGPYAFSAAELPRRFQVDEAERKQTITGEGNLNNIQITGSRLQKIRLPDWVEAIGDYAFYGCRELKEIAFSDSVLRIGSGAFMGCAGVDRLEFTQRGRGNNSLYQMLSELRYAMEIRVRQGEKEQVLVVPEYYESSVENIPARILELHYQGTGYGYRQCFRGKAVDYRGYDRLFGLAKSQEPSEVLAELAYSRLKYPEGLSEEAKKMYLEWFSSAVWEAGEYFLKRDNLEAVRLICEAGGFDGMAEHKGRGRSAGENRKVLADGAGDFYMASMGEHVLGEEKAEGDGRQENGGRERPRPALDILMEMAGRMGRTEILSCLMDYCHRKLGGRKKKVFEL